MVQDELQELRTNNNAVFRLFYHLVLVIKYRRRVLGPQVLPRALEILRATAEMVGCSVIEAEGEADHVHVLLEMLPKHSPCRIVNTLKGVSARRLRAEFPVLRAVCRKSALWSPSYCLLSAGGAPLEVLKKYIEGHRPEPA